MKKMFINKEREIILGDLKHYTTQDLYTLIHEYKERGYRPFLITASLMTRIIMRQAFQGAEILFVDTDNYELSRWTVERMKTDPSYALTFLEEDMTIYKAVMRVQGEEVTIFANGTISDSLAEEIVESVENYLKDMKDLMKRRD